MDIEEVAAQTPEKILTIDVDLAGGISAITGAKSPLRWGWRATSETGHRLIANLYRAFVEKDSLEINPLVVTGAGI